MVQVSVCVLSYNFEKYISQTIDSIVSQVTNFDFEVIICDDCSPDNSKEILVEYQKKYPDLIKLVLLPENTKGRLTLFKAVEQAKGKYIALLEGDDFWCNDNKLQMQFDFMEANPDYSAVITHLNAVDETGKPIKMPKSWGINADRTEITIKEFERLPASPFVQSLFYRNMERYISDLRVTKHLDVPIAGDNYIQAMLLNNGPIKVLEDITATYRIVRRTGSNYSSRPIKAKAEALFNTGLLIQKEFGDKINVDRLMESYFADSILFGYKSMTEEQHLYLDKMTFKRKLRVIRKMISCNFKRLMNFIN